MKYRSRLEIVADMLRVAREGAKKTHIMYQGNLSFKLVNVYLDVVTRAGFLRFDGEDGLYFVTEKGKDFLQEFKKRNRRVKGLRRQMGKVQDEIASLEAECFADGLPDADDGFVEKVHGDWGGSKHVKKGVSRLRKSDGWGEA